MFLHFLYIGCRIRIGRMLLRQHATAEGCFSATLSERFTEPFLHSQVEAGEDGLGAEMEHGVHLARHREAALLAAARFATYRYRVLRAVGEYIVGYPAALREFVLLHAGKPCPWFALSPTLLPQFFLSSPSVEEERWENDGRTGV